MKHQKLNKWNNIDAFWNPIESYSYKFDLHNDKTQLLVLDFPVFIFEGIFYGWGLAVSNLPMQFIQPGIALVLSGAIILSLGKVSYILKIKGEISTKNAKQVPQNAKNGD